MIKPMAVAGREMAGGDEITRPDFEPQQRRSEAVPLEDDVAGSVVLIRLEQLAVPVDLRDLSEEVVAVRLFRTARIGDAGEVLAGGVTRLDGAPIGVDLADEMIPGGVLIVVGSAGEVAIPDEISVPVV